MIYVVRHGQTVWNLAQRKQGRMDSPLTRVGVEHALRVGRVLAREIQDLDRYRFLVSPLPRARQTASLIGEVLDLPFARWTPEDLLVEHGFGAWEGLDEVEIEARNPGALADRRSRWWSYVVPGGESYEQIFERAREVWRRYADRPHLVIVTHEMMSKVLRGSLERLAPEQILALSHPWDVLYRGTTAPRSARDTAPRFTALSA